MTSLILKSVLVASIVVFVLFLAYGKMECGTGNHMMTDGTCMADMEHMPSTMMKE